MDAAGFGNRLGRAALLGLAFASACASAGGDAGGGAGAESSPAPASVASSGERAEAEEWEGTSAQRVEELFEGRFAGVQVLQHPGGGISVRIRGTSSYLGSNEPLYVLDGMPIEPGPGGALMGINPSDIESIEVLKDIGSTAYYGSRGANGVIVITTKHD